MKKTEYSESFKAQAVEKVLAIGSPGLNATAKNLGIPCTTLFSWKKKYANRNGMTKSKNNKYSAQDKLKIIAETLDMSENELGEYLRKRGLRSSDLYLWKEEFYQSQKTVGRPKKDPEVFELRKEKKTLEKDLRRKEKAMAEMSARIFLLKKSHEIFGDSEDDE